MGAMHRTDLILADCMMPRVDGVVFCRSLKSSANTRAIRRTNRPWRTTGESEPMTSCGNQIGHRPARLQAARRTYDS